MIVKPHAFIPYRTRSASAMRYIGGVGYLTHISIVFFLPKHFYHKKDRLHCMRILLFDYHSSYLHHRVQIQNEYDIYNIHLDI